ncbi:undaprenyl-diphosphate phosphatase [Pandoraea thiooxydans]|uniref:Phosphoesterase n=1 Tax=Pandoraea thiooxydans TaxID=445709 RepID=A0A0G3ENY5_9BURK|nr:undecaprenyl-diphosphatase [Pandoraea thiooxydans]AKJ67729.1 undecaprenyl-diphosphatase [Pandoraea thiooxydans]APR94866.1 undaprenyl-diphosphate phosphatase [Pandoraea thiooxydans]
MEHLNTTLFLLINAASNRPPAWLGQFSYFFAQDFIWVVPLGLVIGWLRGSTHTKQALVLAALSGLAGLLVNQLIGMVWDHPRPFVLGLGHTLIAHAPDSSFPSDHLTLIWSVAFAFVLQPRWRRIGTLALLAGLPIAWARIYVGVHFPLDMAGSLAVGVLAGSLAHALRNSLGLSTYQWMAMLYRQVCAPFIRRGWFVA